MKPAQTALQRYFSGIAESVFESQLGVADVSLVDYVSDLLQRFIRLDAVHWARDLTGRPITEVAEMLMEANARLGSAKREMHRHIGDFTLFWAGVYPEALRERQAASKLDHFLDYCVQGKRAYHIASQIDPIDQEDPPGDILGRLSENFEMCAYGLREIRREWERRDEDERGRALLLD